MSEPVLPWDTTIPEDRLAVLGAAVIGFKNHWRAWLKPIPERQPDRGEDHSATKTRILGRWAARTAVLLEQAHDTALVEQERREQTRRVVKPITRFEKGGRP